MNTTMQTSKISRIKLTGAVLAAAAIVGGGGYLAGVNDTAPAQAETTVSSTASSASSSVDLIPSAVDFYYGQQATKQGIAYMPQRVSKIEVKGSNARIAIQNGDSGAVAYAHYDKAASGNSSGWTIVAAGQAGLDQATASQYGMPKDWVHVVPSTTTQ